MSVEIESCLAWLVMGWAINKIGGEWQEMSESVELDLLKWLRCVLHLMLVNHVQWVLHCGEDRLGYPLFLSITDLQAQHEMVQHSTDMQKQVITYQIWNLPKPMYQDQHGNTSALQAEIPPYLPQNLTHFSLYILHHFYSCQVLRY